MPASSPPAQLDFNCCWVHWHLTRKWDSIFSPHLCLRFLTLGAPLDQWGSEESLVKSSPLPHPGSSSHWITPGLGVPPFLSPTPVSRDHLPRWTTCALALVSGSALWGIWARTLTIRESRASFFSSRIVWEGGLGKWQLPTLKKQNWKQNLGKQLSFLKADPIFIFKSRSQIYVTFHFHDPWQISYIF